MMRAVLAVMAGLLCALLGLRRASALKGDAARLIRWGQALAHLSLLVREGTMSLPDALLHTAQGRAAPDMLLTAMASAVKASPMLSLSDAFLAHCGDVPEKDALHRMFERLGRGTKEARSLAIDQCREEIALLCAKCTEKAEKDAKLWTTLGFTGGLCITIFLI